jgi:hypothetical protein
MRAYNYRRNRKIISLVMRMEIPQKEAAAMMGITWANLRQVLFRLRHVTKCNNETSSQNDNRTVNSK